MEKFVDPIRPFLGLAIVQIAIIILGALVIQTIVERYIGRIVERIVDSHQLKTRKFEQQRQKTLVGILRTASAVIIWVAATILVMSVMSINIAALATGAGLVGIIIGFGAQDAIKDFINGIFVIAENQYRVGDVIAIGDQSGVVEDITIRITRLRDMDGNVHIIPNGHGDTVTNMTFDFANININLGVGYGSDLKKVESIINEEGHKLAKDYDWKEKFIDPIEFLRVEHIDGAVVTVKAYGKVAAGAQWNVSGEFRRRIKAAFEADNIEMPYPQTIVHNIEEKPHTRKKSR